MSIRVRLTLWYAGIMFVSLMVMGALSYRNFIVEPRTPTVTKDPVEEERDFDDIAHIVVWCGVPSLLLAVFGGWWLVRKSLAPMAALTQAASQVNEGNLHEQLPRSGNGDEFDRLTEVFNGMLARLNQSFARIHEFTLHASHELKTPLTVLRGQAETALRENTLTPAQKEFHAGQLEELSRLTQIVDSLTLLAKADAGLLPLKLLPLRLDEIVKENFSDAQILAHDSGIQIKLLECEPLTVCGDQHRLRQLLLNLADNAVKYNCRDGRVTLALRRTGEHAQFSISNTGPGIPEEALPRLFDRFYRVTNNQDIEGSGLGLSIVSWIVSAHNGEIKITSQPAQPTTVTVTLPLAVPRVPSASV